jgi:hypothetical protein
MFNNLRTPSAPVALVGGQPADCFGRSVMLVGCQLALASGTIFRSPRVLGMMSQYGSACVCGIAR